VICNNQSSALAQALGSRLFNGENTQYNTQPDEAVERAVDDALCRDIRTLRLLSQARVKRDDDTCEEQASDPEEPEEEAGCEQPQGFLEIAAVFSRKGLGLAGEFTRNFSLILISPRPGHSFHSSALATIALSGLPKPYLWLLVFAEKRRILGILTEGAFWNLGVYR
jgi:hypothetical protein